MEAIRIKKHLKSDTIHLPDLKKMIGKDVEIIVLVEPNGSEKKKREPGTAKGMITIADDFEAPLDDEIIEEFYK